MNAKIKVKLYISISWVGVSDGVRTRDFQIHNLALYQLSYAHHRVIGF